MKRPLLYLSTALLLFSVFAAPAMLGANREWSVALVTMGIAASLALLALGRPSRFSVSPGSPIYTLRWPITAATLVFAIAAMPLLLSRPESTEGLFQLQGLFAPDLTMVTQSLLGYAATCLAILAAYLIGTARPTWRRPILYAFIVICTGYSLSGIFSNCLAVEGACQPVSMPFVNRNSAATFFGFGLILSTLFLMEHLEALGNNDRALSSRLSVRFANWASVFFGPAGLFAAAVMATGAALLLTRSRGGFLAVVLVLALVSLFRFLRNRRRTPRSSAALLPVALIALLGMIWLSASSGLMHRFEGVDMAQDGRVVIFERSAAMIADRPLLGQGLGTFQETFPRYRTFEMGPLPDYDKAHNSYLDLAAGLGLPGMLLVIAALGGIFFILVKSVSTRRHSGIITLAGMAIMAQVALHSVVDFSMQIPGVQVSFGLIIGIALASAVGNRATMSASTKI